MTITRIRIDVNQGILEVEGTETFVREVYNNFKNDTHQAQSSHSQGKKPNSSTKSSSPKPVNLNRNDDSTAGKKGKRVKTDQPKLDKSLDLSGINGLPSLKDYAAQYAPKDNQERNAVFVSYLKDQMELEGVSIDHVWTCYHDMELNYPGNLKQSLIDTSARKGWLNTDSLRDLSLSIQGKNWIRQRLKQDKAA